MKSTFCALVFTAVVVAALAAGEPPQDGHLEAVVVHRESHREEILPDRRRPDEILPPRRFPDEILPPRRRPDEVVIRPAREIIIDRPGHRGDDLLPPRRREDILPPRREILPPRDDILAPRRPVREVIIDRPGDRGDLLPPRRREDILPPRRREDILPPRREILPPRDEVLHRPVREVIIERRCPFRHRFNNGMCFREDDMGIIVPREFNGGCLRFCELRGLSCHLERCYRYAPFAPL